MSLHYSFSGKRVLVTGGGRGLGLGISKLFYQDGAILYIIDKEQHLLDEVKEILPKATLICQDLLDWNETRKVIEGLGPMDHLVNNAGIIIPTEIVDVAEVDFDRVFGVNVKAIINCSAAFVNAIKLAQADNPGESSKERTIVNISSGGDRMACRYIGLYNASKAAVTSLTRSMAVEFAEHKIRVNCVCPGPVDTDMMRSLPKEVAERAGNMIGLRCILSDPTEAVDVAQTVLFLSSPLASKITATSLLVDGGLAST